MIELVFFTSSRVKLSHAKYLCRDYAVQIVGFREKTFGANYVEPRIYDREQLIELSYQDALLRWQKAASKDRIFFIEDTSVTIDALSVDREVPGLDIKYWMAETEFSTLDAQLKARGNNRRVTVRSDLVLHLSSDLEGRESKSYRCFTSTVSGHIVEREESFETNPMYPWLDNRTFNKWFVPDGCSQPISMLPIAQADQHDFRAAAFGEMLEFLETHQKITHRTQPVVQTSLDFGPSLFIVCGPTCAGKTTLAEYLADRYGYFHIEASDFMYLSYYQRHGVTSKVAIGDFAEQALREQPEIVAEQALRIVAQNEQLPVIITGFRSPAEVDWFCHHYSGQYSINVVYVTAHQNVRYARSLKRCRDNETEELETFIRRDLQQASMGLTDLETNFSANRIDNDDDLDHYFRSVETCYANQLQQITRLGSEKRTPFSGRLEDVILIALAGKWQSREYFTTTEIAELINQTRTEKPKNKNNISRYFNQTFHPYYEIRLIGRKKKYRLSNTGYGKARVLGVETNSPSEPE